jgi:hypothetical protein
MEQWMVENEWPKLDISKEEALEDVSTDVHITHSQGCWWGVVPVRYTLCCPVAHAFLADQNLQVSTCTSNDSRPTRPSFSLLAR